MEYTEEVNGSHATAGRQFRGLDGPMGSKEDRDMELKAINAEIRNLQLTLYGESRGNGPSETNGEGVERTSGGENVIAPPTTQQPQHRNTSAKGQNVHIDLSRFFSAADLPGDYENSFATKELQTTPVTEVDSGGQTTVDSHRESEANQSPQEQAKDLLQPKNSGERLYAAALEQQRRQAQQRRELINSQNRRMQKLASSPTRIGKDDVRATVYRRRQPQQLYLNSGVSPTSSRNSSYSPRKTRVRRRSVDASEQLYQKAIQQQQKAEAKRESVEARRRASATPRLNRQSLEIAENIGGNVLDRLYTAPLARRRERLKAQSSPNTLRAPVRSRSMSVDYKRSQSPEAAQQRLRRASISGPIAGEDSTLEKRFGEKYFSRSLEGNAEQECTFRPLLSRRSVHLLKQKKNSNENSIEDFLSRLEEYKNERDWKKDERSRKQVEKEMSPCTFHPMTTSRSPEKSESPGGNSSPSNWVSSSSPPKRRVSIQQADALYERQSIWRQSIQAKLEATRQEKEGEKQEECTFQPNIRARRRGSLQRGRRRSSVGSQASSVVSERRDVSQHVARQMEARRIAEENRKAEFLRDIHPLNPSNDIQNSERGTSSRGSYSRRALPESAASGVPLSHSPNQDFRYASNTTGNDSMETLSLSDRIARLTRARQDAERVSNQAEGMVNRQDSRPMDPQGSWSNMEHESTNGASPSGSAPVGPGSHIRDFLVGNVDAQLKSDEDS